MHPHKILPKANTPPPNVRASKSLRFICLLLILFAPTPACRHANNLSDDKPRYGGQLILPVYGTVLSNSALDPAAPTYDPVARVIYEGLVRRGATVNDALEPALAESWTVSDDNLVWRFNLRRNVRFHDDGCFAGGVGREVTASDFIYSWERLFKSEKLPAGFNSFGRFIEGARAVYEKSAEHASGLRALDEHTLEVHLTTPFVGFLQATSWLPTSVVPHEAVERYGEHFADHPVGAGAFRFVEWNTDQYVIVARHPHYWKRDEYGNQLPYLDSIKYQIFTGPLTTFQSLKNGVSHLAPLPPDLASEVLENGTGQTDDLRLRQPYAARHLYVYRMATLPFAAYLCFQMERATPFTRDARLRRAVAYAIQRRRDAPQKILLNQLLDAPIQNEQGFVQDMSKAETLLAQAGYPHGRGLPKLRLLTFPAVRNAYRAVINNLNALGIQIEEKQIPLNEKEFALRAGDYDLFIETWDFYYHDISSQLTRFLSNAAPEENSARYRNAPLDALIEQVNTERNEARRRDLIIKVEDLLEREAPYITFDESPAIPRALILFRGDVHIDAHSRQNAALDMRRVWLAAPAASTDAVE
jgi:oligopeptide transport system substrate-binding protein